MCQLPPVCVNPGLLYRGACCWRYNEQEASWTRSNYQTTSWPMRGEGWSLPKKCQNIDFCQRRLIRHLAFLVSWVGTRRFKWMRSKGGGLAPETAFRHFEANSILRPHSRQIPQQQLLLPGRYLFASLEVSQLMSTQGWAFGVCGSAV